MQNCSIYLASQSPRRKEILERAGIRFTVCDSTYEEGGLCLPPAALVEELSKGKAMQAVTPEEDCLIIGADTVVSLDNQILGKPADEEDAFRMLRLLSGRSSLVYTGVFLLKKGKNALTLWENKFKDYLTNFFENNYSKIIHHSEQKLKF